VVKKVRDKSFIFLCFFTLYAVTASGDLIGDSEIRWTVAKRFVDTGWVDLPPDTTPLYALGRDGKPYSLSGPGQSVFLLPFVVAGQWLTALMPSRVTADQVGQLLASVIFFPACGALAIVVAYAIVVDLTARRDIARWIAVVYGLATMHWHHTVNTYEESQVAVCLLTTLWALQRASPGGGWSYLATAFGAMGLALFFRVSSVVASAPLVLVALGYDLLRSGAPIDAVRLAGRWFVAGLVGLGPFVVLVGAFNAVRFGSPWESGYAPAHLEQLGGIRLFETPLLVGLSGMLLSPGKSVFLFNPILLPVIPGFLRLWRVHRRLAACVLACLASTLVFHSRYTFWAGDLAWGPRYLASTMGLCVLGLVPLLECDRPHRKLTVLMVLSIGVQLASIVYSFGLEFFQDRRHGTIPDGYVWRAAESQLVGRFRNIALHLASRPNLASIPPERERAATHQVTTSGESVRRLHAVNVFPFKALAFGAGNRIFSALLAVWASAILLLVFLTRRWASLLRKEARSGADRVVIYPGCSPW
jgi:hypothetical protein